MSLLGKLEFDTEIKASARKFHEMFKSKPHHITHASSHIIQGCELHEGEWGTVGSIIYWNYVLDGKPCVAKEIVEAIDEENNSITFNILEGDLLDLCKTFKLTIQATPKEEGGVVHWTFEYEKRHEANPDPHTLSLLCVDFSKDLDEYLLAQS